MKNKANKKGMTLVEVIIAMSVFAIISTGFVMSAKYAYTAQVKAKKRLTQANTQTMNLEDYRGTVDPSYAGTYGTSGDTDIGVSRMANGDNKWTMTFDFDGTVISNNRIYGYYATPDVDDKVYQLAFFSPADVVALEPGEYWITIINSSSMDLPLNISCASGFQLFNNEKKVFASKTSLPERLLPKDDYKMSFGIKDMSYSYSPTGDAIIITDAMAGYPGAASPGTYTINPSAKADSRHYVEIIYTDAGWPS